MRSVARVVCAVAVAWACAPRALAAPTVVRTVGEASPLGWPYSTFAEGTVDAAGGLAFLARSTAVFARDGAQIVQRLGPGDVLPDGRTVAGVGAPALAADGCVFAHATFQAGGDAIVRSCAATHEVVVDGGGRAPGGGTILALDPTVAVAGTEAVAMSGTLADGNAVLLRHDGGGLVEIARTGGPAPTGGTFSTLRLLGVASSGDVAFRATVSAGRDGIFFGSGQALHGLAVAGQASPAGGSFGGIDDGTLHPSGAVAFRASLSTGGSAIFATDLATRALRTVVRENDPLPIASVASATIRGFASSSDPSINAAGTIAFRALVTTPDDSVPSGIFTVAPDGGIATIALVRETVTGLGTVNRLRDPVLAEDGSVVVPAFFIGGGSALLVARDGVRTPLARLGDATSADVGDARFAFGSPSSAPVVGEAVAFLGERDALFRAGADGTVAPVAYGGQPGPLGGTVTSIGSPVVDRRGTVFFGAEFRGGASFNEALLRAEATSATPYVTPDRRLLGGGGIRELFPTGLDALARPAAGSTPGVVFTASLQGAKASTGVFRARSRSRVQAVAAAGQRVGGMRLAALGTPSAAAGPAVAFLAKLGRSDLRTAVVGGAPGRLRVAAVAGKSTGTRVGGSFESLGPPAVARAGAVFRATLDQTGAEGVFVGRGGRPGVVAANGDVTTAGSRLRTFGDPVAFGEDVWFLARTAGSPWSAGLYHVRVPRVPRPSDAALAVEPVLLPGDPLPEAIGGIVVRLETLRVGPSGVVTAVATASGGVASGALLAFSPSLP